MGGRSWRHLHTPRISTELYLRTRERVTEALKEIFTHVCVPVEMPSKTDFGDVDLLVAGPRVQENKNSGIDARCRSLAFPYDECHLTDKVMFFAIRPPWGEDDGGEDEFWIQVDVEVCEDHGLFEWQRFYLNYATLSQSLGNMIKPVGLTMDEEGLYVRVSGLENVNWEGSKVLITKEPLEVKVLGLYWKLVTGGFSSNDKVYEAFASSWLFNPAHFGSRRDDETYMGHLSKSNIFFIQTWIPEFYPGYKGKETHIENLKTWYDIARLKVIRRVFSLYPRVGEAYYSKYGAFLRQAEEARLRNLLLAALPGGLEEWSDDLAFPPVVFRDDLPQTPPKTPELAPKTMPWLIQTTLIPDIPTPSHRYPPLILPCLSFPLPERPRPPQANMSRPAKLLCLARWTLFHPITGQPYLAQEPRPKGFEMDWASAGVEDDILIQWARKMWCEVWMRQSLWNSGIRKMKKEEAERKDKEILLTEKDRPSEEVEGKEAGNDRMQADQQEEQKEHEQRNKEQF